MDNCFKINLQGVILAAGQGKRLHPITVTRTKAMAPILNKPIIRRVIDSLMVNGIKSFIVVASPEDEEINDYFEYQSQNEAEIKLVLQPEPLGMGHALQQAVSHIHSDFVLSSCDNLVDSGEINQMFTYWLKYKPDAILTTLQINPQEIIRMGVVELNGDRISRIVEKPSLETSPSNIGSVPLYIFSRRFLKYLDNIQPSSRGEYELQDAIQMMINDNGSVRAFPLNSRRDLTTPEDLLSINFYYLSCLSENNDVRSYQVGGNTHLLKPFFIDRDVVIGSNCQIGPNVFLEYSCKIGNNVRLQNSIVLRGRSVSDDSVVIEQVVY